MIIPDIIATQNPFISMEFFPPRSADHLTTFSAVVSCLCQQKPDFFTVTFGAGGSTKVGTYQTVKQLLTDTDVPTVAHLAGAGLGPEDLCQILDQYQDLGVKNIFVVRGDAAKDGSFAFHPQGFPYASDLIAFIRERYDFTIGCAGYPEGHVSAPSYERDIEYLQQKVESGGDYILTQYFHDNEFFFRFVEQCRSCGITVPIIPGIMPVYSLELTQRLSVMCGASIPKELQRGLRDADADTAQQFGIAFALKQCKELLQYGVAGLHFYTMNRSTAISAIMAALRQDGLIL